MNNAWTKIIKKWHHKSTSFHPPLSLSSFLFLTKTNLNVSAGWMWQIFQGRDFFLNSINHKCDKLCRTWHYDGAYSSYWVIRTIALSMTWTYFKAIVASTKKDFRSYISLKVFIRSNSIKLSITVKYKDYKKHTQGEWLTLFSDLKQINKPVLLTLFQTLFNRILLAFV